MAETNLGYIQLWRTDIVYQFWRSMWFLVEVVFYIIPCGLMHHIICLKETPYIRKIVMYNEILNNLIYKMMT